MMGNKITVLILILLIVASFWCGRTYTLENDCEKCVVIELGNVNEMNLTEIYYDNLAPNSTEVTDG